MNTTATTAASTGPASSSTAQAARLLGSRTTESESGFRIDMEFSTEMARGQGVVYITDGAVQTVIDRMTGLPAIRIVGASETHAIPVSDLQLSGTLVILEAAGLGPGRTYNVFMADGVLREASQYSYGGITVPGTVSFLVPDRSADKTGPAIEAISFSGTTLDATHDLVATISFSEAVRDTGLLDALYAGEADLSGLASSDGGKTWTVTLSLPDGVDEPGMGMFGVDMAGVRDLAGNAGLGFDLQPAYAVNMVNSFLYVYDDGQSAEDGLISDDNPRSLGGVFFGDFPNPEQGFELSVGGVQIDKVEIHFHSMAGVLYWYYDGEEYWSPGSHQIVAKAVRAGGEVLVMQKQVTVDGTGPAVTVSPASGDAPPPFDVTGALVIEFDEAVYFDDEAPRITVNTRIGDAWPVTTTIPVSELNLSPDRKTLTIPADQHRLMTGANVTLFLVDVADMAGNALRSEGLSFDTVGLDKVAPVAVDIYAQGYSAGVLGTGESVRFTIDFNEPVTLVGDQERYVTMSNGGRAVLEGADLASKALSFRYTVQAGDADQDYLGVADLGGLVGGLKDAHGNVLSDAWVDFGALYLSGYGSFHVDQTAPAALPLPVIAAGSDTGIIGDAITRISRPAIQGTGAEPGARIYIELDGRQLGDVVRAGFDGKWTWTSSSDLGIGLHALKFWQEDRAGLVGAKTALGLSIEGILAPLLVVAENGLGVSSLASVTTVAAAPDAGISGHVGGGASADDAVVSSVIGAGGSGDTLSLPAGHTGPAMIGPLPGSIHDLPGGVTIVGAPYLDFGA